MGAAAQHNVIAISHTPLQNAHVTFEDTPSQDGKAQQAGCANNSSSSSTKTGCWNAAKDAVCNPTHWGRPNDQVRVITGLQRAHVKHWGLVLHAVLVYCCS
jgi:hypothetical protein